MSKKVLIMSASTGGGHNRAAKAMKEEIEKRCINGEYITCEIVDSLKLINTTMDKIISSGYEKSSRLKKLLKESKPDLIIGTHPFPMIALSTLKKKYPYRNAFNSFFVPPLISVLTDYTAHSAYIQDEIDYYIAGDEYVREVLISEGIEDDKIKPYGIPVEKSFLEHRDKNVVLEELGLEPDKFTVLLMGGSFGAGNIKDTLKELSKNHKLFIVSNCQDGYIECFFKAHKLDKYFTDYECPGRTGLSKGENNKLIIERNNLKNPVYVGDTEGDAESAKAAGIPFVFAKYGFGNVKEYQYAINKFEDLSTLKW